MSHVLVMKLVNWKKVKLCLITYSYQEAWLSKGCVIHINIYWYIVGNYRAQASSNIEKFKYAVLRAITDAGNGTSPLRINNIQVTDIIKNK